MACIGFFRFEHPIYNHFQASVSYNQLMVYVVEDRKFGQFKFNGSRYEFTEQIVENCTATPKEMRVSNVLVFPIGLV
jgi:hypothetical protein